MNDVTILGVMLAHPALGVVICCTVAGLGFLGYLAVRRVCDTIERCCKEQRTKAPRSEPAEVPELDPEPEEAEVVSEREMELRQALKGLGYKEYEIDRVVGRMSMGDALPALIKQALKDMPNRARAS